MAELRYRTLVTGPIPQNVAERVPNGDVRTWSPMTSTLILGATEAVLVDPQFTVDQAHQVVEWVKAAGRSLSSIYVTHWHGDHWLAAPIVLAAFPGATLLATRGTIAKMTDRAAVNRDGLWDRLFPGQIPTGPVPVEEIPVEGIALDGERLLAVEVGHSDTDDTTVLWAPSLRLVVAGDVVYHGVHQYLAESGNGGRDAWRRALDRVEELDPASVVCGHHDPARGDEPGAIAATRQYLDDVDRLLADAPTRRGFFDAMLRLHPDRLNPGALWGGATALLADD